MGNHEEDVGNHVAFGWTHMCCSVLILVPPILKTTHVQTTLRGQLQLLKGP